MNVSLDLTDEQALALMEERARKLARVEQREQVIEDLEVATFALANERYAVESKHIREIAPFTGLTRVPGAPDFVAGVVNLHGQIVAIIDIRRLSGLPHGKPDSDSKVIVLGHERTEFAIIADSVDRIERFNRSELLEPPDGVSGIGREHMLGVTLEALIVLDGEALMNDKRLVINQTSD